MTFAALAASTPMIMAILPENVQPVATVACLPNPAGVNQPVYVALSIQPFPPSDYTFLHGLQVKITAPDGTTENKGPWTSSPIGSYVFLYTPAKVGAYTFEFSYPGETFQLPSRTYKFSAASTTATLTVQQDPVTTWQENPLPSGYWTRPIPSQYRTWSSISGDWLMESYNATYRPWDSSRGFNPYSQAPRSAHIMWIKELGFGGLVGGEENGDTGYYPGMTYENKLQPPIIMDGKLFYNLNHGSSFWNGFTCVDLRTGETLWTANVSYTLALGQEYNYRNANQEGVIPYLWSISSNYKMLDAFTGQEITTFSNGVTANTMRMFGPDGSLLVYCVDSAKGWIALWNSTRALVKVGADALSGTGVGRWRPPVGTFAWSNGIQWNKTIPIVTATVPVQGTTGNATAALQVARPRQIVGNTLTCTVGTDNEGIYEVGYDLTTGAQKWKIDAPDYFPSYHQAGGQGVVFYWIPTLMSWKAYDAETGQYLYTTDPHDAPYGMYTDNGVVAYGKYYVPAYDGCVHAFDINTGKQVWKFYDGNAGLETPYGTWPFQYGPIIADGVVFAANGEHSPEQPMWRGAKMYALDAESGRQLWNISGFWPMDAIADGYLVTYNANDNCLYTFGKGPSATTVTAPDTVQPLGTPVLIKGTVTDQSPAQKGSPAIADVDMGPWMEYLNMQAEIPANAKGVPVTLTAMASDGTVTELGTVVSDMSGMFSKMWTPPTQGTYTIVATFAGTDSYGSSYAETAIGVSAAPASTPTPTPEAVKTVNQVPAEIFYAFAVIMIALIIVLAVLIVRKK